MIPDIDIYRSANVLVKRHSAGAPIHAAMRADPPLDTRARSGAKSQRAHAQSGAAGRLRPDDPYH